MISYDQILKGLVLMLAHYPDCGRGPAELRILAKDYHEALQGFSPDVFTEACKQHKLTCSFFPHLNELFLACNNITSRRTSGAKMLPEITFDKTDEDIKFNKQMNPIILLIISKKITVEEALKMMSQVKDDFHNRGKGGGKDN